MSQLKKPSECVSDILFDKGSIRNYNSFPDSAPNREWWGNLLEETSMNCDKDSAATMLLIVARHMPGLEENEPAHKNLVRIAHWLLQET